MLRLFALLFSLIALPAYAQCVGTDLISEMNPERRAALYDAANDDPYPNGFLWQATRGDQIIHLIGTLHVYDPRHQATFDQVKLWLDAADTILLELGDGDEARVQAAMATNPGLGYIVDGPTLPELLSPEDWALLSNAMKSRGIPGFLAAKMKPWTVLITLGSSACLLGEVQQGKRGLDHLILDYAASIENPGQALEPFDTAFHLFDAYDQDEILEFVRLTLRLEDFSPDDQLYTTIQAYFRGDVRIIWEFALDQGLAHPQGMSRDDILAEYAKLEEALIYNRNRAWMDPILTAADKGRVVVAAGALHLPGEDGVLRLLEKHGFTLLRIPQK